MAHDITIILDKIGRLKGNANTGSLNALARQSTLADDFVTENPNHAKAEAVHEWLEGVQEKVTSMDATADALLTECPV